MSSNYRLLRLMTVVAALIVLPANPAPAQPTPKNPVAAEAPQGNELDYQKVPINTVIDLLQQLSGKHYVLDANLDGVPPISVNATGLSKDDSIKLITSTLLLNGVAIIPVDDHTMKVVTVGTNKNPRSEGMRVYMTAADLPTDDEIVTYYMALDHIDPQEAAGIFTQVAPVHTYGSYVPAPAAQGVILTENASVIRELIALKTSIDVRKAPNVPRPPPPDRAGPPGKDGLRPPPPRHPLGALLIFLVIVAAVGYASFRAGVRRGRLVSK